MEEADGWIKIPLCEAGLERKLSTGCVCFRSFVLLRGKLTFPIGARTGPCFWPRPRGDESTAREAGPGGVGGKGPFPDPPRDGPSCGARRLCSSQLGGRGASRLCLCSPAAWRVPPVPSCARSVWRVLMSRRPAAPSASRGGGGGESHRTSRRQTPGGRCCSAALPLTSEVTQASPRLRAGHCGSCRRFQLVWRSTRRESRGGRVQASL